MLRHTRWIGALGACLVLAGCSTVSKTPTSITNQIQSLTYDRPNNRIFAVGTAYDYAVTPCLYKNGDKVVANQVLSDPCYQALGFVIAHPKLIYDVNVHATETQKDGKHTISGHYNVYIKGKPADLQERYQLPNHAVKPLTPNEKAKYGEDLSVASIWFAGQAVTLQNRQELLKKQLKVPLPINGNIVRYTRSLTPIVQAPLAIVAAPVAVVVMLPAYLYIGYKESKN